MTNDQLSQEETEFLTSASDPIDFLTHTKIQDPTGYQTLNFDMWDYEKALAHFLLTHRLVILLKARQLGVSTVVAGLSLWLASFREAANVMLISKREEDAKRLMAKVKFMHSHLPDHLRATTVKSTETKMIFAALPGSKLEGSSIIVLPATEDAGRSETASLVVCDEWAFHPYARANYTAFKPTIDAGGSLWGISTANGMDNLFFEIYSDAKKGANNFQHLFLPWWARPDRDQEWFDVQKRDYSPEMLAQEYPADDMEAFIVSGGCPFDSEAIRWYMENEVKDPLDNLPDRFNLLAAEGLKVWELPRTEKMYCVAGDPSEGVPGSDYAGLVVMDAAGEQVADLHGFWDPDRFAHLASLLGYLYNTALVIIERNNHGHATLNTLSNYINYPRLYKHMAWDQKHNQRVYKLGWPSTPQTKSIMISDLVASIRERGVVLHNRDFFEEAVKIGTRSSKHQADDHITKVGLAIQAIRSPQMRGPQPIRVFRKPAFAKR